MTVHADVRLDAKGLACPMPIVKTKKAMADLAAGKVIEIQATDKGSLADLKAWSTKNGHHYLGTDEDGDVLIHYVRKGSDEDQQEKKHEAVATNDELASKLDEVTVLDVREEAEYHFGHIPGAVSVPLGELEAKMSEIPTDKAIYVVCRTGSRSDLAAQMLTEKGFNEVVNVLPGMTEWEGPVTK
ncbi:sulfurtransferase TusA family protein [Paenalkalicoccus suaedae]|uniref:Sulfurtransferase TusA family protein n=1 Tax=Paenalkalicoccus suaedae TaxID=2592382 RepID=A0A859FE38_9BACI|nr:sulfurtransferase TusA family protein [Paenalkalicoccus suaedae]QKS71623.1 sulfurtransferase TusA family protein [Paenalkalicoccus suaedae]